MEHQELREDKTCLNCRHVVEKRYCPNCGQENSESRKTFYHLFTHFFEDLTHYENAFWKTIRNLLFRPASLTREYLSGKRMSYLAPVRLYIFISFLTFLLLGILPSAPSEKEEKTHNNISIGLEKHSPAELEKIEKKKKNNRSTIGDYMSVRELDSVEAAKPESERLSAPLYWMEKKLAYQNEHYTEEEFWKKFGESILHNIPKALFLYMPFFAFFLWLFHGKKRWFYFDHGIFTLHYFSFMLLTFSIFLILNSISDFLADDIATFISVFSAFLMMAFWFFYFFRSHRRFYGESRLVSRLKGFALFFINIFFILIFIVVLMLYTAISID